MGEEGKEISKTRVGKFDSKRFGDAKLTVFDTAEFWPRSVELVREGGAYVLAAFHKLPDPTASSTIMIHSTDCKCSKPR